jgi:hypothetical protein
MLTVYPETRTFVTAKSTGFYMEASGKYKSAEGGHSVFLM